MSADITTEICQFPPEHPEMQYFKIVDKKQFVQVKNKIK
jgi:hypothetical protein